MFVQMRTAAKRSHQCDTTSPPDVTALVMSQKESMTSQKEFQPPEMEGVPMELDAGGATAAPPCDFFGNFLGGECSHATGDSLTSPPHSANKDLCHLKQTFGPQNIRRRNESRANLTTLSPRTKFDAEPCRVTALCYSTSGDLLVADSANAKVKCFNGQGQLKVEYIIPSNYGSLIEPVGLSFLPNGEIIVADREAGDLKVFTAEGCLLTTFGRDLTKPCDISINKQGHVIVVEETNNKIHIYEKIGEDEATKTISGDVDGKTLTSGPRSITTVATTGNIIVGDESSKSIITYDEHGKFVSSYTSEDPVQKGSVRRPMSLVTSYSLGHLKLPAAIADDHHGNVLVLDGEHARISQFDLVKNVFIREVISREDGLSRPRCMAVSPTGMIAVTEDDCDLVKIFNAKEVLGW